MAETLSLSNHIHHTKVFDNDVAGSENDGREQYWAVYTVWTWNHLGLKAQLCHLLITLTWANLAISPIPPLSNS